MEWGLSTQRMVYMKANSKIIKKMDMVHFTSIRRMKDMKENSKMVKWKGKGYITLMMADSKEF